PYSLVQQAKATVGQNGHVRVKSIGKYLSAPYRLIGQKVTILMTRGVARIYHARQCVATHAIVPGQLYSSNPDHLSSVHKHYVSSLSPDSFRSKALAIGPEMKVRVTRELT